MRRVFRASKFAFVDTLVVVLKDVKWFLLFLLFTMWVRKPLASGSIFLAGHAWHAPRVKPGCSASTHAFLNMKCCAVQGFACAFHILYRTEQACAPNARHVYA